MKLPLAAAAAITLSLTPAGAFAGQPPLICAVDGFTGIVAVDANGNAGCFTFPGYHHPIDFSSAPDTDELDNEDAD